MKNVLKKNNGITLIALIITIIVMLILVAVTINMAVNGGLFGYAGNAARDTKAEKEKEENWTNPQAGMTTDELIDYYTQSTKIVTIHNVADNNSFTFRINRNEFDNMYGTDWFDLLFGLLSEQYPEYAVYGGYSFYFQHFFYDEECQHLAMYLDNETGDTFFEDNLTFDSFPQNLYVTIG